MRSEVTYYWVRVFDYDFERDRYDKGTLLDEFYLKDVAGGREEAKKLVRERYCSNTGKELKFRKPKNQDGIYAIIMDSEKYWYDRFYTTIDTHCFWCLKPIKGKASEFPRAYIGADKHYASRDDVFTDPEQTAYFCTTDCKIHFSRSQKSDEGEFQVKEEGRDGDVYGYIYLIYNKDGRKGDIRELSFSVLTEVKRKKSVSDEHNQQYLNSMEAWWIEKYKQEGHQVFNISKPKITIASLKERFTEMVLRQEQMSIL